MFVLCSRRLQKDGLGRILVCGDEVCEIDSNENEIENMHVAGIGSPNSAKTPSFLDSKVQHTVSYLGASLMGMGRIEAISLAYAGRVREGYRPHPRHWEVLAQLVGVSANA
jgi:hypothetical protein